MRSRRLIDTDMLRDLPIEDRTRRHVRRRVQNGDEDLFPDPMSATMTEAWRTGVAKKVERQNAALVQAQALAA